MVREFTISTTEYSAGLLHAAFEHCNPNIDFDLTSPLFEFWCDGDDELYYASVEVYVDNIEKKPWAKLIVWHETECLHEERIDIDVFNTFKYEINNDKFIIHTLFPTKEKLVGFVQKSAKSIGMDIGIDDKLFIANMENIQQNSLIPTEKYKTIGDLLNKCDSFIKSASNETNCHELLELITNKSVQQIIDDISADNVIIDDNGDMEYMALMLKKPEAVSYNKYILLHDAWCEMFKFRDEDPVSYASLNFLSRIIEHYRRSAIQEIFAGYTSNQNLPAVPNRL